MSRDLYKILGIARTASADEIRRAYKRKAKESHPDLHPDDPQKADTFKSASAAYEILGDAEKRAQYDRGEIDADGQPRGFAGAEGFGGFGKTAGGFQGDPFEEIFSGMFGGGRRRPGPRKGADMRYRVEISFEDAVTGARREMTMADGRALNVAIPPGIESGRTLRLKSQGKPSNSGGPPGDALLEIFVRPSKTWTRDGDDIRMTVAVPLKNGAARRTSRYFHADGATCAQNSRRIQFWRGFAFALKGRAIGWEGRSSVCATRDTDRRSKRSRIKRLGARV